MSSVGSPDIGLEIHISSDQKGLIEQAAAISGQPVASFTASAAVEAARHVLQGKRGPQSVPSRLGPLLNLLDDPPEPNDHLKRAVAAVQNNVVQSRQSAVMDLLARRHDRQSFDCGSPALNEFLKKYARQNAEQDLSRTYVAIRPPSLQVLGFYTICGGSARRDDMPGKVAHAPAALPRPS